MMMVKDLNSHCLSLSPLSVPSVCGVAENRSLHCHCRSHAILADTVGNTEGSTYATGSVSLSARLGHLLDSRCRSVSRLQLAAAEREQGKAIQA